MPASKRAKTSNDRVGKLFQEIDDEYQSMLNDFKASLSLHAVLECPQG